MASPTCSFENSSGHIITYVGNHDWQGNISKPPYQYPDPILNERLVGFKHVSATGSESESAVIFSAEGTFDWLVCWYVTHSGQNHVYTEIRPANQFRPDNWDDIRAQLERAPNRGESSYSPFKATVTIGNGISPEMKAIIKKS